MDQQRDADDHERGGPGAMDIVSKFAEAQIVQQQRESPQREQRPDDQTGNGTALTIAIALASASTIALAIAVTTALLGRPVFVLNRALERHVPSPVCLQP